MTRPGSGQNQSIVSGHTPPWRRAPHARERLSVLYNPHPFPMSSPEAELEIFKLGFEKAADADLELLKTGYQKAADRYDNIYRSIWTIFSYMSAVSRSHRTIASPAGVAPFNALP